MSEFYGDDADGFEPVDEGFAVNEELAADGDAGGGEEWQGVSRAEWEAAQETLAAAAELRSAVEWQTQQDAASQAQAEREQWVGDPYEDPAGYAERLQQLARIEAQTVQAPLIEWIDRAANEYASMQADAELEGLIGHHPDPEAAVRVCDDAIERQIQQATAQGMSLEEAESLYRTRENALEMIAIFNAEVERQSAIAKGDEVDLVNAYFQDGRPVFAPPPSPQGPSRDGRPAGAPQYASDADRQMAEFVLGRF